MRIFQTEKFEWHILDTSCENAVRNWYAGKTCANLKISSFSLTNLSLKYVFSACFVSYTPSGNVNKTKEIIITTVDKIQCWDYVSDD